ncbi:hypothetical protein [Bradyrhizobium sp. BRP56]|uniref:hypothetical protein n=1 Tax=Bradyrhizobium sp. BRP56 TaxID=2793819 RepID=UPI001CD25F10|nr:hypothetical protein [Bradyrhizobium sp. BRP56]MCA1395663.1 hypothetical protein [Bradyrhizobium sp. BRP56]
MVVVIQYACFGQYHQNVGVTPTRIGWWHITAEHAAGISEYLLRLFATDPWLLVEKKGRVEACSMNRSKAGPQSVLRGAVSFFVLGAFVSCTDLTRRPTPMRLRDGHSDIL